MRCTLLLAALLGCSANQVAPPVDGGQVAPRCSGSVTCDGLLLRACRDGEVGEQIGDCESEGACSSGRCMSTTCMLAERDRSSFAAGCLFYTAEVDNVDSDADLATSFLVTNPGGASAMAVLQRRGTSEPWVAVAEASIAAGKSARLLAPPGFKIAGSGPRPAAALRVSSDRPVTVEQIESDDSDENALSSGGTLLLPIHVLGSHYLVMTYPQVETAAVAATGGGAGGAGRLIIVGTQAGTGVTIKASTSAVVGLSAPDAGFETTLGDGDVLQAWTDGDGVDLSGSEIVTTHPVAVFSGNIATTYGKTAPGIHSPDMAHEQMPPVYAWSLKYVAAALPPQAGVCDPLIGPPGTSVWRLLAANAHTNVRFMGPDGVPPVHEDLTMVAGQVLEVYATSDFVVTSSEPLLMTQGIDCEPSLSLAVSADQLLADVSFAVLPSFDQMVAIARVHSALVPSDHAHDVPVLLDGELVDDTLFSPAGGGYEVARVLLSPCLGEQVCTHRLVGSFGMTLRGMDVLASYALTAPAWMGCNDPFFDSSCVP